MKQTYKKLLGVSLSLLGFSAIQAQDLHYSQFYNSPQTLNPALTGMMREDFRVGAIYRSQWQSVNSPYKTMSFWGDMNFKLNKKAVDMVSAGLNFTNDELGDGIFKNQYILVSGAAQKYLGYSRRHFVSGGLQAGVMMQNLNKDGLLFEDQFNNQYRPVLGSAENLSNGRNTYVNVNAGLAWEYFFTEKLTVTAGAGFHNLLFAKDSYLDGIGESVKNRQSVRTILTAGATYQVSKYVSLLPAILYARQAKASDFNLGTNIAFHLGGVEHRNRAALLVGGFYRLNDAAIGKVGFRFKGFQAMFSYDATTSGFKDINKAPTIQNKTVGAYEFSLIYAGFLNRALPSRLTVPSRFF
ncbi:type IX secretion system membrane protein, PorP/SprF family [Flexibacter flexilis DSM 6793]|uniref:Type IX secretion system membrane protein, PorP/SprF family n=1 Tax=Flexibacter flexilis DSM 6793 TaxID=927664 RepID=A0A1I1DKU9_9BACT|nr:PorP/SprF family type IX secretion system membrane protein [Flexibacter flexilis]SFB75605.1 type IX secretion system membrane protein, PorP/SprF family [Flexibacter flexilis DSM 6793]